MPARHRLTMLTAALAIAPALGQVAPPPPPPTTPEPEFVPPPMPAPRPAAPASPVRPTGRPAVQPTESLPNLPYPGLWEFCGTEDASVDEVCRFDENLHYVALKANPTISPGMVPSIQQVVVARRARFEQLIIDNLDVTLQVDGGLLNEVGISDPTSLQDLLEAVKPLTPPTNLTQELQNREIITSTQGRFNNKIIGEYQRAYGDYLRRADPDNSTDRFMRSMFEDSMLEPLKALDGMLHESRGNIDGVLARVEGVPAEAASALRALAMDEIRVDPALLNESAEAVKLAWRPLSIDQKRQYLLAVRSLREAPDQPPVPVIDVMHAGKRVVEGEPAKQIKVNPAETPENDG